MIEATVDSGSVLANLNFIEETLTGELMHELLSVAFELLRLSQMEVPHDIGTLQNSGVVEVVNGEIVVGYHEPYAARLHEHPEYRFGKGRKGKYLEDPILKNAAALGIMLIKEVQDTLQKGIK